jgi:hypothetical protein
MNAFIAYEVCRAHMHMCTAQLQFHFYLQLHNILRLMAMEFGFAELYVCLATATSVGVQRSFQILYIHLTVPSSLNVQLLCVRFYTVLYIEKSENVFVISPPFYIF